MAFIRQKQFRISRLPSRCIPAPAADDDAQLVQQAPPGNVYSDAEKNLDLYLALGMEVQRCFNGTPDASNFDRPHADFVQVTVFVCLASTNWPLSVLWWITGLVQFSRHPQPVLVLRKTMQDQFADLANPQQAFLPETDNSLPSRLHFSRESRLALSTRFHAQRLYRALCPGFKTIGQKNTVAIDGIGEEVLDLLRPGIEQKPLR